MKQMCGIITCGGKIPYSLVIIPAMEKNSRPPKYRLDVYDFFILGITLLSLVSIPVISLPYFNEAAKKIALALDLVLSFLFMLDFFYILSTTPDKRAYLKWGWIDFVGSLPYLTLFRVLRIFRAFRSLRLMRNNRLQEIWQVVRRRPERTTFFAVMLFAIILVVFSSYTILQVENLSPNSNIKTSSDALWWSLVTVTTV